MVLGPGDGGKRNDHESDDEQRLACTARNGIGPQKSCPACKVPQFLVTQDDQAAAQPMCILTDPGGG